MKPAGAVLPFVAALAVAAAAVQAAAPAKVRVAGDRVSLRARPDIDGELLDRAMRGEEFDYAGETNGWIAVQAPASLNFWVAGEYIEEGIVQPGKLNVRSGPSVNYSVVGVVGKGDALAVRGEFGDWLKVAPPPGCLVWISAEYAEPVVPPAPDPVVAEAPAEPAPEPESPPAAAQASPAAEELPPLLLVMDKSREQGAYDEMPGILRRANPGLYQLVYRVGDLEEPVCLVRGREEQMERYLNRSMLIKGRKYWAENVPLPIIQPEKIHLDPILKD